jgi:hypothetical protein
MDHLGKRKSMVEDIKRGRERTRRKEIVERERDWLVSGVKTQTDRVETDAVSNVSQSRTCQQSPSRGHEFVLCVVKFGPSLFARDFL